MQIQNTVLSQDDQTTDGQALAAMRTLTTDELREIVGGPEIKNGGGGLGFTSDSAGPTGG